MQDAGTRSSKAEDGCEALSVRNDGTGVVTPNLPNNYTFIF